MLVFCVRCRFDIAFREPSAESLRYCLAPARGERDLVVVDGKVRGEFGQFWIRPGRLHRFEIIALGGHANPQQEEL